MNGAMTRPAPWLACALLAQVAGVVVLAILQRGAFVAPATIGEASAVGVGYAVLIAASASTCGCGSIAAYAAVRGLAAGRAVLVVVAAAPLVFLGVAELYATLAMLALF